MTYSQYVSALAIQLVIDPSNTDFLGILPTCINYAEDRIYRECDLIAGNVRDSTTSTTSGSRNFNLPTSVGTFLIVDGINVITPAGTAPESGTRVSLQPATRDYLDYTWPSSTGATVPQYFAYLSQDTYSTPTQTQVIFGPWPDNAYRVEVIGRIQPTPLSSSNTTTWLSTNLFDLFFAASMVYMTSYQQNFGGGADNPAMAIDWNSKYEQLKSSAAVYEARKRFASVSWTSKQPEPLAQPQRG